MGKLVSFMTSTVVFGCGLCAAIDFAQHLPPGAADSNIGVWSAVALMFLGLGGVVTTALNS